MQRNLSIKALIIVATLLVCIYGITGIPTLILFKNGQMADRIVGAVPSVMLEKFLQKHLQIPAAP